MGNIILKGANGTYLMSKLEANKEPLVRFTVDLPEPLHMKLSLLAARKRRKKADIVREWFEEKLKDVEE